MIVHLVQLEVWVRLDLPCGYLEHSEVLFGFDVAASFEEALLRLLFSAGSHAACIED